MDYYVQMLGETNKIKQILGKKISGNLYSTLPHATSIKIYILKNDQLGKLIELD